MGFLKVLLERYFEETNILNREKLLQHKVAVQSKEEDRNFFIITTFHPNGNVLGKIITTKRDLLERPSAIRTILESRIILSIGDTGTEGTH